jgi:hypothetical protein
MKLCAVLSAAARARHCQAALCWHYGTMPSIAEHRTANALLVKLLAVLSGVLKQ